MLRFLNILNLAVIDSLQVEFRTGLNVLSGETGSGKSIIIDALGLLLGERASAEMVRTGSDRAFVEGTFGIAGNEPLNNLLTEYGVDTDSEEELIIRRELGANGRGRIFVNNRTANIGLLKAIQPHVIDLHGQGDHQSLLSTEAHLYLLDAFAGAATQRQRTSQLYEILLKAVKDLEEIRQSESERLQALDIVEFQIAEIEQSNVTANEDVELEAERNLLANAERLSNFAGEAFQFLYDDETSALARLGLVQRRLSELAELDTTHFSQYSEQIQAAKHILEDIAFFLRGYAENIQASPERLKYVEERLVELGRLKRKYGGTLEELLAARDNLVSRKEYLLKHEERAHQLEEQVQQALEAYLSQANELSRSRRSSAQKFERSVCKEMADVALSEAKFSLHFSTPATNQLSDRLHGLMGRETGALRRFGKEQVEFFFSANPGEELKPMNAVASGGELSRLMLVLKTIMAPSLFPRTLIFDEIDAGIGGRVADAVGQRLRRLAETNQVLCVTHQSQIARYADAHFQVSKEVAGGRTTTKVVELDKEGRIDEIARMIGGSDVTQSARKHAKELLRTI